MKGAFDHLSDFAMSHPKPHQLLFTLDQCRLVVIQDQLQPCPYLRGKVARMPLRLPLGGVTAAVTDELLALGFRRTGEFVYRAECPACRECQPTRVDVSAFHWTKSFRRVLRRGDRQLEAAWGEPQADQDRVALFNQHRQQRGLEVHDEQVDLEAYRSFLVDTCLRTDELAIRRDGQLVAVAIIDVGDQSLSAVYTFFDPASARLSLGTYAILKQIQRAERESRRYVYLGMHVAANPHLNYKARFLPQQRLIRGRWQTFGERAGEV